MRIPKLLIAPALCLGLLAFAHGIPLVASSASVSQQAAPEKQENVQKELIATVVSVDLQQRTIKIEEMGTPIGVTSSTAFDEDVQLDKLRAGMKVKLILSRTPEGRIEAMEVHTAK